MQSEYMARSCPYGQQSEAGGGRRRGQLVNRHHGNTLDRVVCHQHNFIGNALRHRQPVEWTITVFQISKQLF